MRKYICPESPDEGCVEAENSIEARMHFNCDYCGDCSGPVEYKDRDDVANEKAEACAAQIMSIAANPRIDARTKHIQAEVCLCRLLRDLGHPVVVEAYEEILKLEGAL